MYKLKVNIICGINEFGDTGAKNTADMIKNTLNSKNINMDYQELLGRQINHTSVRKLLTETAEYLMEPNRKAFVYYNGHGNQKRDINGDEADDKDEYWSLMGGGIMLDDEISTIFNKINEKSFLLLISDCCSSGTMLDRKLNNKPWICLSSCRDPENSLASSMGGIFTLFGLIPAIKQFDNIRDISNSIKNNIDIPTQNYHIEVTREWLWTTKLF